MICELRHPGPAAVFRYSPVDLCLSPDIVLLNIVFFNLLGVYEHLDIEGFCIIFDICRAAGYLLDLIHEGDILRIIIGAADMRISAVINLLALEAYFPE